METMSQFVENYQKEYGYKPTLFELADLYRSGQLVLNDLQEDDLLSAIELLNL
jgi:hypothetical protein